MKNKWTRLVLLGIAMVSLTLSACGGGGSGGGEVGVSTEQDPSNANFSLHVHVTGLDGSVTLANGSDTLVLSEDGEYVLSDLLTQGASYNVSVTSHPFPQTCAVMHPEGRVSGDGDVIDIFVNCAELNTQALILGTNDTSSLTTITPDSLVFSVLPSTLVGVMPGDVIFSEQTATAPDGLLRKVVSVDVVNGETVIETEDGVLTDIIQNGGFSFKGNISAQWAAANPQGKMISPSTTMMSSTSSAAVKNYCDGKDIVRHYLDYPISEGIYYSFCTGFDLDLDVGVKITKLGKIDEFRFIIDSEAAAAAAVSAETNLGNINKTYNLLEDVLKVQKIKILIPLPIGPITIPTTLELDLIFTAEGEGSTALIVGTGATLTMKAGAILEGDNNPIPVKDFKHHFDQIGPEINATLELRAEIGPELAYKIAGAAGPELALSTPYLNFTSDILANPWWTLDAGTNAKLSLTAQLNKIKGFGWLSDKWSFDYAIGELWDKSETIAQAQGPFGGSNAAPTANFNFNPLSPEVGQTVNFTNLSTDPDGDTLSSYWSLGDGNLSTTTNPSHAYSIAGDYQVFLEVFDPSGDSGSSAQTITVAPAQQSGSDIASPWGSYLAIGSPFYNVFFENNEWKIITFELTSGSLASATFEGTTYTGTWAVDENEILNISVSGPGSSYWGFLSAENNRVNVCFSDTLAGLNNCENEFFYFTLEEAESHSTVSGSTSTLPDTGQITCFDASGAIINCAGTGQDGEYSINPMSFADNGNGTVTDKVTGLIWQQTDDGLTRSWEEALDYCIDLPLAGGGWRLPSVKELVRIIDYGSKDGFLFLDPVFNGTMIGWQWSSTPNPHFYFSDRIKTVHFSSGLVNGIGFDKTHSYGVRCVR